MIMHDRHNHWNQCYNGDCAISRLYAVHIECSFKNDLQYPPKESIHLFQSQVLNPVGSNWTKPHLWGNYPC